MKYIIRGIFFSAILLLVGCIKIPFGDGQTLTISTDGINFETDEKINNQNEGNQEEQNNTAENEPTNESNTNDDLNTDNSNSINNQSDNSENEEKMACQEEYDSFLEKVPQNFPMPDCVSDVSSGQEKRDDHIFYQGGFRTNHSWKEMRDLYKDYLNKEYEVTSETEQPTGIDLYHDDDKVYLRMEIYKYEENWSSVKFWFYDYD